MNLQSFTTRLFSHRKWPLYLVGIIILLSQFFTAAMNIINSLIWWGRIDLELILIGCIDSFAVALLIAPVATYLVRHSFNLEEMNRNLQKEVAERTMAEEALRKSEERYRTILENIEDGYHELDLKGNFTFFNESFRKIMGYTKDELLGMNYKQYSDQENAEKVFKAYNQIYQTGEPLDRFAWEIMRKDGVRRDVVVSVSLIKAPSGKPTGFRGIVRDETDRQEAERALIRSEKKYRDIFDNAVEGIYRASLKGRFLSVNPSLAKMTGFDSPEEMITSITDIAQQSYVNPEDRKKLLEILKEHNKVEGFEFEAYRKDKSTFWISTNIRSVRDVTGQILYLQGMCVDITERRQGEEALKRERSKFQLLVEKSPLGISLIDKDGIYQFINPKFTEILGYALEDVSEGREWFKKAFPDPVYRQQVISAWINDLKEIGVGESRPRTFKVMSKDSQEKWINFRPVSMVDGSHLVSYEDISERKLAEDALRSSEEKFSRAFKTSPDAVSINRLSDGLYLDINESFTKITGYTRDDVIGRPSLPGDLSIWVRQEDRDRFVACLKATGEAVDLEAPFQHKDGSVLYGRISARVMEINGEICLLSITSNITARRQAEESLRKSEERYRNILESIEEGYYEVDIAGNLTFFNDSLCDMLGYSRDELMGLNNRRYTDERNANNLYRAFNEVYRTGIPVKDFDWRVIRKDGTTVFGEISVSPIRDREGNITGFRGIARDITERKRVEEALRESEERYRVAIEQSNDGIALVKEDRHIYVNKKMLEIFGYEHPEEIIGQPVDLMIHPDDQRRVNDFNRRRQKGEAVPGKYEFKAQRKDGESLYIEVSATKTYYQGEVVVLVFLRDVTERKRAEEEKRKLEERLQRAEKMEALGTLAGGVAHDLNNVLGGVLGFSELLLYDLDASSPLRPWLVNIMKGSQKAAAIVQDLLTLARRGISGRKILNLNKIIFECQNSPEFGNLSSHHSSVKIKTDLEPDLLNISGSAVHLGKTLFNLISNASEAMPNGGTISIKTSNQYLDRPIQGYDEVREGDYVLLSVSDTGEGILSTDLERIFEPFYTKKVMGRSGTGLGLAVVWGTVKDHHGYINVQSQEGKGSTFTLYFPVTREEITAEEVMVSISEFMGKGESILIVDDVKVQRDLATTMLRKLNYSVTGVESGEGAVSYLMEHKVDLMVLDMILDPGMDGLDTYKRILESNPQQKAIIVSGFSETERVNTAQTLGAGGYVRKPYVLEKIGLAVRRELDK